MRRASDSARPQRVVWVTFCLTAFAGCATSVEPTGRSLGGGGPFEVEPAPTGPRPVATSSATAWPVADDDAPCVDGGCGGAASDEGDDARPGGGGAKAIGGGTAPIESGGTETGGADADGEMTGGASTGGAGTGGSVTGGASMGGTATGGAGTGGSVTGGAGTGGAGTGGSATGGASTGGGPSVSQFCGDFCGKCAECSASSGWSEGDCSYELSWFDEGDCLEGCALGVTPGPSKADSLDAG